MTRRWRWWWKRVGWIGTFCGGLCLGAYIAVFHWMAGFYVSAGQYQEWVRSLAEIRQEWSAFKSEYDPPSVRRE